MEIPEPRHPEAKRNYRFTNAKEAVIAGLNVARCCLTHTDRLSMILTSVRDRLLLIYSITNWITQDPVWALAIAAAVTAGVVLLERK